MTDAAMEHLETKWREAEVDTGSSKYEMPEPGIYYATFIDWDYFNKEATGDVSLISKFEITHDEKYAGREVSTFHSLTDAESFGYTKGHLAKLGVNVEETSLAEILRPGNATLAGLVGTRVEIDIVDAKKIDPKTNKPYRNAYLRGRVEGDVPVDTSGLGQQPTNPDDDIPF
jgi:hypothetical protein